MLETIADASVDFVVNTFEKTYRNVLAPGFIEAMATDHLYSFTRRVILINNVDDRADAERMAKSRQSAGEISGYHFVADLLTETLIAAKLSLKDLQPNKHYSDCSLVAVFLNGSNFLVYCDAEVRLAEPCNWIEPSLTLMETDSRIAVANPNWFEPTLPEETRESYLDFGIGYGFSDQLFLLHRREFARPIYKFFAPISLRYPMSERGRIFEQMVDSYMRVNNRMRATYTLATYVHGGKGGASHPKVSLPSKLVQRRNRYLLQLFKRLGLQDPCYKV